MPCCGGVVGMTAVEATARDWRANVWDQFERGNLSRFDACKMIDAPAVDTAGASAVAAEGRQGGAAAPRLVQGSKCPTGHTEAVNPPVHDPAARLIVEHREWSDEYRVRLKMDVSEDQTPPEQSGPRITSMLTERGARALWDSCDYVATEYGGYTTFLTLTLDAEARERIERRTVAPYAKGKAGEWVGLREETDAAPVRASGEWCEVGCAGQWVGGEQAAGLFCRVSWGWESSIQREVSRFLEGAAKMRRRGWVARDENGAVIERVEGDAAPWLACWVAENPLNADGERNPHVHVLMRWSVPRRLFPAWARRLESLWGQGFAHLEKLRRGRAAGYYMAKAAGYLSKAANAGPEGRAQGVEAGKVDEATGELLLDQGPIRGNRYGISQPARAPDWYELGEESREAWHVMGYLIKRAHAAYQRRVQKLRAERDAGKAALKACPPKDAAARRRAHRRVWSPRAKLRRAGVAVGRWQVVCKGRAKLDEWFAWARGKGWRPVEAAPMPHWAAKAKGAAARAAGHYLSRDTARDARRLAASIAKGAGLTHTEFEAYANPVTVFVPAAGGVVCQ